MSRHLLASALLALGLASLRLAPAADAREYLFGGSVHARDMETGANYRLGGKQALMSSGMAMGPDVLHLEADVHATADNVYGYPDDACVGYLAMACAIEKQGSRWRASGTLLPMQAKDGPHDANNVRMDGPAIYKVTYRFTAPGANGFLRHVDHRWAPFDETFTSAYPQK